MNKQNLFIVPYVDNITYENNVDTILELLSKQVKHKEVMLTEGEYSYIHKKHDVIKYSQKYDFEHRYHSTIKDMINTLQSDEQLKPWSDIKYIVVIGTWAPDLVDNCFTLNHPDITIIHIQGPILPKQYLLDKYENLERFNIDIQLMANILISQFLI